MGKKKEKKKRERQEIDRAGELLESSSGSKGKIKEERMKGWGAFGKWSCGSKEKGEVLDNVYVCDGQNIGEKKKEKETYGGKKAKELEITI